MLSVTGASPTALPGGSAVDLTSSVTLTDTLQNIASATVTISSGRQTGDTLSFHSGASSWTFADGRPSPRAYNSTTGVLTLSGVASAADYQPALDSVSFATTSTTGTSRTLQLEHDRRPPRQRHGEQQRHGAPPPGHLDRRAR